MNKNIPKYRKIWSNFSLFKFCPIQSISSREFFSQHMNISKQKKNPTGLNVSHPWCCSCTSAQNTLKLLKLGKVSCAGSSFGDQSPCADASPGWDRLGLPGIPRADTKHFPEPCQPGTRGQLVSVTTGRAGGHRTRRCLCTQQHPARHFLVSTNYPEVP